MLVRLKVPRIWTIDAGHLLLLVLGETDLVAVPLHPKEVGGIGPTGAKIHDDIVIAQKVEHLHGRDNNTSMRKCRGVKLHIDILHIIHHILENRLGVVLGHCCGEGGHAKRDMKFISIKIKNDFLFFFSKITKK